MFTIIYSRSPITKIKIGERPLMRVPRFVSMRGSVKWVWARCKSSHATDPGNSALMLCELVCCATTQVNEELGRTAFSSFSLVRAFSSNTLRPRTQSVTVFSRILIKSRNLKFQQALLQSLIKSTHRNWVYLKRRLHFTVDSICFKMFRWYILTKINVNQVKDTTPFLHVLSRRHYKYQKYQIKPIT